MSRTSATAFATAALVACLAGPVWGHGEQRTVTPEDGSRVAKVPGEIELNLTEPPGPGSTLKAFDGCNNKVEGAVATSGDTMTLTPAGGEPGRWHIEWRSISSVDGHPTKGHWIFRVAGSRDCSDEAEDEGDQIGGGETTRVTGSPPEDEGGGFPVVPFAAGTVVVVGLAFVLRRASGSS
ncbi:MAG: copper resistance CopC family protein [Actinomycetota bacterium]